MDEAGGSPLDGLIDMEISLMQKPQQGEPINRAHAPPELLQTAQAVFAPQEFDPTMEKNQVQQVVDFAFRDCGCESPAALINLLNRMHQVSLSQGHRGTLLQGVWGQINRIRYQNAMRNMNAV